MTTSTRTDRITAPDGGAFAGHVALPPTGRGPGLVLIQEIFGVNAYIRDVADRLARLGYVVVAPDMFWRLEPGVAIDGTDEAALGQAMGYAGRFDGAAGVGDLGATLAHVRAMPECTGSVGVIGFCFGGTFSYLAAAHLDPVAVVSYYGSGVAGSLDVLPQVTCPILFHFGDADPYLPNEDVARLAAASAGMPNVEILVQAGSGHAFDNAFNPNFSDPPAAAAAWARTVAFLTEHLPA